MPDLLGVTNAVPGNDANLINRNMPSIPNDPRVQNATDLNRVSRTTARSGRTPAKPAARLPATILTSLPSSSA